MTARIRTLAVTIVATTTLFGTIVARPSPRFIWNSSDSVPVGLYRLRPAGDYYVTQLLAVRPPEPLATFLDLNDYLPTGVPMLKRVMALPGQTVCRNGTAVSVDGIEVGQAQERDGRGRPLPVWQGCDVVGEGELFLMNWQSAVSLDGRYFGLTPSTAVIGQAQPEWTMED